METINSIIGWLEEKNHFLRNFLEINERELGQFEVGRFETLEAFYENRERILGAIKRLDELVQRAHASCSLDDIGVEVRERVLAALDEKDLLVAEILSQDLQILSLIDAEKSNIIKDLRQMKKSRTALSGYRSSLGLAKRIDEEF